MKRLIYAECLEREVENLITSAKRNVVMAADLSDVEREKYATQLIEREEFRRMLLAAPTVDAVEVTTIERWLYEIAINNVGVSIADYSSACEEIAKGLNGLRAFAKEV